MHFCSRCGALTEAGGTCQRDGTQLQPRDPRGILGHAAGNYTLVAHIASGAAGDIYRGVHPALGATVAVKVLVPSLAQDQASIERFLMEAQATNRIDHAGVVKVLDGGLVQGRTYAVMDLLQGTTLADAMREQPQLALGAACNIAADALAVLAAAHRAGVVHRDVKPENIFLTTDGTVKLLDFGIARLVDRATRLTGKGNLLGTPAFMAPEQIRGDEVDARTDVYAVGAVLYELLCGALPFDNTSQFTVLDGHLNHPPTPLAQYRPNLPQPLVDVVMTALAKAPAQRFVDAIAMQRALQSVVAQLPAQAYRHVGPSNSITYQPWETAVDLHASDTAAVTTLAPQAPPRAPIRKTAAVLLATLVLGGGVAFVVKRSTTSHVVATREPPRMDATVVTLLATTTPRMDAPVARLAPHDAAPALPVADARPIPIDAPTRMRRHADAITATPHVDGGAPPAPPAPPNGLPPGCRNLLRTLIPRMSKCPAIGPDLATGTKQIVEGYAREGLSEPQLEAKCREGFQGIPEMLDANGC